MTILRYALRAHRSGAIATALLAGFICAVQPAAFVAVAGKTAAERQAFGHEMQLLGQQLTYLLPLPVRVETVGGYVQWRALGFIPLVFGFWALMAGSGALRGDEDKGLLEEWLVAGISRTGIYVGRIAGFLLMAAAAIVVAFVLCGLGFVSVGEAFPAAGLLQDGLALFCLTAVCFAIALLISQLVSTRRAAAGLGAIVLLALFLIDSLGRTLSGLARIDGISPFNYYYQTNALTPGGRFDVAATIGLGVAAAVILTLSLLAFVRRDLGAPLLSDRSASRPPTISPSRDPLLRVSFLEQLYEQRVGLVSWVVGIVIMALFFVSLAKTVADLLQNTPSLRVLLAGQNPIQAVIGAYWFGIAVLLLAIYSITQVSRWTNEDLEGRLEMVLSNPIPRWRVVVERFLALLIAIALLVAAGALTTWIGASGQGIELDGPAFLRANLVLIPFALSFGAVGAALTGRLPRATILALSTLAALSYFDWQFGPLFKWPDWLLNLSVFHLYGTPLTSGIYWPGVWIMLGITVAGFALGIVGLQRRDLGR